MKKAIMVVICCALLTACGENAKNVTKTPDIVTEQSTSIIATEQNSASEAGSMTEVKTEKIKITIYSGNENADGFIQTEAEVDKITEKELQKKLIEAGVLPDSVEITALEPKDGTLILRFNEAFRTHLLTQGTTGEHIVIGSVVNTFLKAYDAQKIYLYIGDETLETGHMVYDSALEFYE